MPGADDGFEYEIALKDSLSGPSEKTTSSLDAMTRALLRIDQNMRFVAEHGKMAAAGVSGVGAAARHAGGGAHGLASGISYAVRGFDDLARGGRYAANGLLDVGKAFSRLGPYLAGAALVGGAAALAKYSFEVSEFKEQTVDAFSVFTGSTEKGAGLFRAVDDLAESVHAPAAEVAGKTKELLELGLTNQAQLTQTVRAIEDLQRVGLEGGARKIEALVERSLAAGHFVLGKGGAGASGASRALTGTGVSEAQLAAQLGINPKQLEAQLKSGKITVEEGLAAIDRAIIQGKVGDLATKKFTVSDAFTDLHNSVRKLFQEADDGPITDALRRLSTNFADGTDGARQLSEATDLIFRGIGASIRGVIDFGETINYVFDEAWNKIDWFGDIWATIGKSDAEAKQILAGRHATRAGQIMGGAIDSQEAAFAKVQHLAQSGASEKEIKATAERLGIDVSVQKGVAGKGREAQSFTREIPGTQVGVQDIGAGGSRGDFHADQWDARIKPAAHAVGVDAAKGMIEGAKGPEGFDAHSPSRKMFDIGVDASDGMQEGAEQAAARGGSMGSGGKSVQVHVDVGGIDMHGSIDSEEFMSLLESQVADVFERAALELGE